MESFLEYSQWLNGIFLNEQLYYEKLYTIKVTHHISAEIIIFKGRHL